MQNQTAFPQTLQMGQVFPIEDTAQAFAWFKTMRETQPVYHDERTGLWHVFQYADVQRVLADYAQFSSEAILGLSDAGLLSDTLISRDPPEHRKLRSLANVAFTPRVLEQFTSRIAQIVQEALDLALRRGQMDAVTDLAFPVSAKAIAALLGVPDADWAIFRKWVAGRDNTAGPQTRDQALVGQQLLGKEMYPYFTDLLTARREAPRGDVLSTLSMAEVDGTRLSDSELVKFCILLLTAGQETTKNLIANGIYFLTEYPELQAELRAQPDLIPAAIEEMLRYLPPVWFTFRRTTIDVELSGQRIPANAVVHAWNLSANHDPAVFPDPERLDIHRPTNHHLAFGHGIHLCLGAPLARLEARVLFPMVLDQLHGLRRVPDVPVLVRAGLSKVLLSLPITFQPRPEPQGRR